MTNETFKLMKKNFETASRVVEAHNEKARKLRELLNSPEVLKFITLQGIRLSKEELTEYDEDYVMQRVLSNYNELDLAVENSEVFFCNGKERNGFKVYINMEDTSEIFDIPLDKSSEFEEKHTVIFGDDFHKAQRSFIASKLKGNVEEKSK